MGEESQPERAEHRQRRDRDLVKGAALLLSSNRPLTDLYEEFVALLAQFVDASIALLIQPRDDALQCVYAHLDGVGGVPDNPVVPTESTSANVFREGVGKRFGRSHEWNATNFLYLGRRSRQPESAIFVPVLFGGTSVGVLSVQSTRVDAYDDDDLALLETCALYLGARLHTELRRQDAERFERLAHIDELTTIANRRFFEECYEREATRARRIGRRLSLLMIDVDLFKEFNDRYGHIAGDACLQQIAATIAGTLRRPTDLVARYGGEEFVVLLPETEIVGAVEVAEGILHAVLRLAIPHAGSTLGVVSVSVGCAVGMPRGPKDRREVLESADAALYRAKHAGRNRVAAERTYDAGPPIERRSVLDGTLPVLRGEFIGRALEIEQIEVAVARSAIVTIHGAAGVGKTRTAIEVARRCLDRFADGGWFVDLARADDENSLESVFVENFSPLVRPGATIDDCISMLQGMEGIVILDRCDRVLAGAGRFVDTLLARAPKMRVIATSRLPLSIPGEAPFGLPPLGTDESERLFVARTQELSKNALPKNVQEEAARVAALLQGHALAIELVAANLCAMSRAQRRRHVERGLGIKSQPGTPPNDEGILRVIFDWIYGLLDESSQRIVRRSALFTGSWNAEAAKTICSDVGSELDHVAKTLSDISGTMLVHAESHHGPARYRTNEATREYAREKLIQENESERALSLYRRYYLELAAEMPERYRSEPSSRWLPRLAAEAQNLHAVLRYLLDARDFTTAAKFLDGLRAWTWERGSLYLRDLSTRLEAAVPNFVAEGPNVEAHATLALANVLYRIDPKKSLAFAQRSLKLYREIRDERSVCYALRSVVGSEFMLTGEIHRSWESKLQAAIQSAQAMTETTLAVDLTHRLGVLYTQSLDDRLLPKAMECFTSCIAAVEEFGDRERSGKYYGSSADVAFYSGNINDAIARARRGIALFEQSDEVWSAALEYINLTIYAAFARDFATARVALEKTLDFSVRYDDALVQTNALDAAFHLATMLARYGEAAKLAGFADAAHRARSERQRRDQQVFERSLQSVHEAFRTEEFNQYYASGLEMNGAEAAELARSL